MRVIIAFRNATRRNHRRVMMTLFPSVFSMGELYALNQETRSVLSLVHTYALHAPAPLKSHKSFQDK